MYGVTNAPVAGVDDRNIKVNISYRDLSQQSDDMNLPRQQVNGILFYVQVLLGRYIPQVFVGFKEVFESFPVPGVQFIHKFRRGLFHLLHVNRFPHCNRQQMPRATSILHSATCMHTFILHFHSLSFIHPLEVLDWCEVYVNSHLHQFSHTASVTYTHMHPSTFLSIQQTGNLKTTYRQ